MPSLIRFIITIAILGGLAYAGMFALAISVEPEKREMRVKIPTKHLDR